MDSRLRYILLAVAAAGLFYFFVVRKHDAPTTVATVEAPLPPPTARASEQLIDIHTEGLAARVSTYSGTLHSLKLTGPQFRDRRTGGGMFISTTWAESALPLRSDVHFTRAAGNVMPDYLTFAPARMTATEVELVATPPGTDVEVRRVIRAHSEYSFSVATSVINHGAPGRLEFSQSVYHWVRRAEESSGFFRQPWQRSEGMCHHDGHLLREWRDDLGKPGKDGARHADFVGLGNLYFLAALAPLGGDTPDCLVRSEDRPNAAEPTGSLLHGSLVWHPVQLASGEAHEYRVVSYFGPKYSRSLVAAAPAMHEAVNLGFFALIARGLLKLLQFLHSILLNWGLSIIVLTLIVRTALYPILARSTKSMAMMQRLKPEIDALNEKYKDNAEQKGLATMELYRKNKVNPVAGCLPQLAQLPIWWALYTTLQTSVELFHSPFILWWRDLSAPDPFYVLPLILGGVMFLQQKLMPAAMPDPAQQKMMLYFMPLFMTGISLFLPSGLALYMLVNSVLAMGQQRLVKAQIDRLAKASPQEAIVVVPVTDSIEPKRDSGNKKNGGRRGGRR